MSSARAGSSAHARWRDWLGLGPEDEEYELPFNNPDDLLANFTELEEQNLSLIQQGQENEHGQRGHVEVSSGACFKHSTR